jgi:hypothetical protein
MMQDILGQACYNEPEPGKPEWITVIILIVVLLYQERQLSYWHSGRKGTRDRTTYHTPSRD